MCMRVASLFSGIGGIDLGFKQAGFDIVWANEIDAAACATYRHNLGNTSLVEDDIRNIDTSAIPDFDILVAGFPCQPFSLVGKQKGFRDDRGLLFFEIERVIIAKKPKIIFLENVANLIEHNQGKSFEQVFLTLAKHNYIVRYDTLNPKTHANIPQQRDRVFLVAFLDNTLALKFKYPKEIELKTKVIDLIDITKKHSDFYYYSDYHPLYKEMIERITKKGLIHRISDHGISKKGSSVCPTLTANMGTYPDRVHILKDDYGIRKLTPYECLKLQGFPDSYSFPKGMDINQAYKQIGNSVCVPVVEKIAKNIAEVLQKQILFVV